MNKGLVGTTKIMTVDYGARTIDEMNKWQKETLIFVWNPETKLSEISLLTNIQKFENSHLLYEVSFDSGLVVTTAEMTPFILFRGTEIKPSKLKPGQSIRAFSISLHADGHLRVHGWVNGNARHQYIARMVWEYYNGKVPEGMVIHHKDYGKTNNHISNLELLTNSEHSALHFDERRRKGMHGRNHKVTSIKILEMQKPVYTIVRDKNLPIIVADDKPVSGIYSGIVVNS